MARRYRTNTNELRKVMIDNKVNTITELSEKTGINRNTLSKILRGVIQPSSDAMDRLVFVLNIEPENAGKIFFTHNLRNA